MNIIHEYIYVILYIYDKQKKSDKPGLNRRPSDK
jgi:hypothetical protein